MSTLPEATAECLAIRLLRNAIFAVQCSLTVSISQTIIMRGSESL
jgi:hypothetical protein